MKTRTAEVSYGFKPGTVPVVMPARLPRVGIYGGSFDPVHAGHLKFALKSQKLAGLERIYFVPERQPQRDADPEHHTHRSAMLERALQPYKQFQVFELPDARLTARSLKRLTSALPPSDYSLLITASDLLWHEGQLPDLYHRFHLVVAVTSHEQLAEVLTRLGSHQRALGTITFVDVGGQQISSRQVRVAIRLGQKTHGMLPSVLRYARKQWLYVPSIRSPKNPS